MYSSFVAPRAGLRSGGAVLEAVFVELEGFAAVVDGRDDAGIHANRAHGPFRRAHASGAITGAWEEWKMYPPRFHNGEK